MMRLFTLVAVASTLISTAYAHCGAKLDRKTLPKFFPKVEQRWIATKNLNIGIDKTVTVPVFWYILYDRNNPADGNITESTISQTMQVVNRYFHQAGLCFQTWSICRHGVSHDVLHGVTTLNDAAIKQKYRCGNSAQILNIYIIGSGPEGHAGWATFPWVYKENPVGDGIVFDYNFLPGGNYIGRNTGKVLVHEIGHWAGLLHTFEGASTSPTGCDKGDGVTEGDYVPDTNPEAYEATICEPRQSCSPDLDDPIHNLMDYTDDDCRTGFTNGQYDRMKEALSMFRGFDLS